MAEVKDESLNDSFVRFDKGSKGVLNRSEIRRCIEDVTGDEIGLDLMELIFSEFDKDGNGEFDASEFREMMKYITGATATATQSRRKSLNLGDIFFGDLSFDDDDEEEEHKSAQEQIVKTQIEKAVTRSKRDSAKMLDGIAKDLYQFRDLLCVQNRNMDPSIDLNASKAIDFGSLVSNKASYEDSNPDSDFESAFAPSDMRCLALVSHNGMKKTMREFVTANKNLLKKFRLTGTNSTMTMLKEVFKDEPPGTVVFGPSCASGPLGGDAELVAHLVTGQIGGIFFFQDPMDSHPHRADIECLCRQVLVHNTMMAETPTSALMLTYTLRAALQGKGKPNLIPSFFFSLQSPTVEAYKAQQKSVVQAQKGQIVSKKVPDMILG